MFRHDIEGGETRLAITHSFEEDEELRLVNRGITALQFALVKDIADAVSGTAITVAANTQQTILASALGDITSCRYLKVLNTDANLKGAYTIELV